MASPHTNSFFIHPAPGREWSKWSKWTKKQESQNEIFSFF